MTSNATKVRVMVEPGVWQHPFGTPLPYVDSTGGPSPRELATPRWAARARCVHLETEPEAWFPRDMSTGARDAIAICARCPVRRECLAAALTFGDEYGIWGGTTAADRALMADRLRHGTPLGAVLDDALADDSNESSGQWDGAA